MQTFLPYRSFQQSAECLDNRRLGLQRVEALQILKINLENNPSAAWFNHPCCKMWRGYEYDLSLYAMIIIETWINRGFKDGCLAKLLALRDRYTNEMFDTFFNRPPFIGNKDFHLSHQSNLIRKDPLIYRPMFGSKVPNDLPYVWKI